MFQVIQVDFFDKVCFARAVLRSMFSDNKSVLEMSTCQNEAAGSQLISHLVIPQVCSL